MPYVLLEWWSFGLLVLWIVEVLACLFDEVVDRRIGGAWD